MKFLLDTHCWLWLQTQRRRFDDDLLDTLADPLSRRYLSAASAWEIAIKYAIGKLPLPEPPALYVPERMRLSRFEGLAVSHVHAFAVAGLPRHHGDPFDRILVAQARIEGLTLVTADSAIEPFDATMIKVM